MSEMNWRGLPTIIIGTSGMAKETKCIIDEINSLNYVKQFDFLGFISDNANEVGKKIGDSSIIATDETVSKIIDNYAVIGVIIPIGFPRIKKKVYEIYKKYENVVFPNVISPKANISNVKSITLGQGNIIVAGTHLTTDIKLGDFNLINMNASIGHDVEIEDYCVINPQAAISGNVKLKSMVLIGASSAVKQGITIGEESTIGLGAFVVKDVKSKSLMVCKQAEDMSCKESLYEK